MGGYDLVIKLNKIAENISNIENQAGAMLVNNIRKEAKKTFGHGKSGYPYEFTDSFQRNDVVFYDNEKKEVHVDHPAAKVLEYGMGKQVINAKNGESMRFIGKDGEVVFASKVVISPKKPTHYAANAIKQTQQDLKKKFKDIIIGTEVIGG